MTEENSPLLEPQDEESQNLLQLNTETKYSLKKIIPALWIGSFICAMDSTIVANIMNGIASEFDQVDQASWIATSFLLTNTAFQPLYGKLSDLLGRKHVLLFAQFWFALGSLLCVFSRSVTQFAIARAIAGIGGGGITSLSSIIVGDIVTINKRGIFQGYANIMFGVGQMIGGPIGGLCLDTIGWRWMFLVQVPLLVGCMILTHFNLDLDLQHIPKPGERFTKKNLSRIDFGGSFTLVLTISGLLFLLSVKMSPVLTRFNALICIISSFSFFYIEKYIAREQIVPPKIFKGSLGLSAVVAGLGTMVAYSSIFIIPMYVQIIQGYTPTGSGGFTAFSVISTSAGSYFTGYFLNSSKPDSNKIKLRASYFSLLGVSLQLVGILVLFLVIQETNHDSAANLWKFFLVSGLILIGFGFGVFLVSLLIIVVATIDKSDQASTIGMNYLFRATGGVLGVALSLAIYNKILTHKLYDFLVVGGIKNGEVIFENLLKDVNYLQNGHLKFDVKHSLITIYRYSLSYGLVPAIILGAVAVCLSIATIMIC